MVACVFNRRRSVGYRVRGKEITDNYFMEPKQKTRSMKNIHYGVSARVIGMAETERKKAGMTKVAFAKYVGFASRVYDLYVGGFRTVGMSFLIRLSRKFRWDMNEIFYGKRK